MPSAALGIILRQPPTGLRTLTLSNVITDATRRANLQGDGLAEPGGFGVWPAATNIVTQSIPGALATTGVTKAGDAAATLTKVTDATAPFQASSADVWLLDNSAGATDATVDFDGNATAAAYTGSVWAKKIAGSPTVSIEGGGTPTAISGTASYARYTQSLTANLNDNLRITAPAGAVVRFTAGQLETGPIANPFIVTNGGTASRSAGRATVPVQGLFTTTQGAVFTRLRTGHESTAAYPSADAESYVWSWRDDNSNRIGLTYQSPASSFWECLRIAAGAGASLTAADTFVEGDGISTLMAWTAAALFFGLDGAAQTTVANTAIPALAATVVEIGLFASGFGMCADNIRWLLTMKGTPTDADNALMHSWGDIVPTLEQIRQLSPGSKPTLLIPAKTADAVLLPAYFGG